MHHWVRPPLPVGQHVRWQKELPLLRMPHRVGDARARILRVTVHLGRYSLPYGWAHASGGHGTRSRSSGKSTAAPGYHACPFHCQLIWRGISTYEYWKGKKPTPPGAVPLTTAEKQQWGIIPQVHTSPPEQPAVPVQPAAQPEPSTQLQSTQPAAVQAAQQIAQHAVSQAPDASQPEAANETRVSVSIDMHEEQPVVKITCFGQDMVGGCGPSVLFLGLDSESDVDSTFDMEDLSFRSDTQPDSVHPFGCSDAAPATPQAATNVFVEEV